MSRNYYVTDKDGNIEMEIFLKEYGAFTVHYPRFEQQREILHSTSCFIRVSGEQLGMLLFAYSQDEYLKFCEFYQTQICKGGDD